MDPATVVIDNGTGFTKMGYAGNMEPSYLIPTTIATPVNKVRHLSLAFNYIHSCSKLERKRPDKISSTTQTWISLSEMMLSQSIEPMMLDHS